MKIEVLIIDDSLDIGESLQLIMDNLGYDCKYFDSSEKGMIYFQNELNPVIFLDIFLPNQNGLDLLPIIKKVNPFTQVIMMTGENDIENVVASLKNKASDFLLKPFSMESVKIAVERGVEYYKLLKNNYEYQENLERDMMFIYSIQKQIISPNLNTDTIYADFQTISFVSGSFYYREENSENNIIIFGDVEGNGVTSSFIGLLAICILKNILRNEKDPARILEKLNDELYFKINIHTLTASCIWIDKNSKQIHYSNGGNTDPILFGNSSHVFLHSEVSNIIGIMPRTEFKTKSLSLVNDSILFLYNSGFLSSEKDSKKEFESFIMDIQKCNHSFEDIKQIVNSHIQNNLSKKSKINLSFFLQKI